MKCLDYFENSFSKNVQYEENMVTDFDSGSDNDEKSMRT